MIIHPSVLALVDSNRKEKTHKVDGLGIHSDKAKW